MTFQPPMTIVDAIKRIQRSDLVLPAIQRAFVWEEEQITRLFDSILRGYPIGSFLSWRVEPETARQFRFYGFMRQYHQRDNRYCPVLDIPRERTAVAVLDGQQRLTALNIGLRGSFASRVRYGRWNKEKSFPVRRLYVNVLADAPENDLGMKHDFRMLTEKAAARNDSEHWFPVHRLFEIEHVGELMQELAIHGIGNSPNASVLLGKLYEQLHNRPALHFYEETGQDIDKVLDIFIRVNSGGTNLSHSDLLLSIATSQWDKRDARDEIQSLLDVLNGSGQSFNFSKDVILKSGLMLTGVSDVGFKVRNFNRANMAKLQENWDAISQALQVAAGLLGDFGLSEATLTANSVLIPIAYYIHRRGLDDRYRAAPGERADRAKVRSWVIRSLLKSGVWGSGLDSLLSALRDVIDKHGDDGFPTGELEARMAARGKGLIFTPEEVEELLGSAYGWADTFVVLALLFPHVNTRNLHHVDHVFPRAKLTAAKLKKAVGLNDDDRELAEWHRDRLSNLQLLEGLENIAKKDREPFEWAQQVYQDSQYTNYLDINALPELPRSVAEFPGWCEQRYKMLEQRLAGLLGVDMTEPPSEDETDSL